MKTTGKAWKYGDDVNTDVIYPGRFTHNLLSDDEVALAALADLDEEFAPNVRAGDVIVGGKNWGCGSSREMAVKCLKINDVGAIIAKGFARLFFRNALNLGLPTIVCPDAVDAIQAGQEVTVDFDAHVIHAPAGEFPFPSYPEFVRGLIEDGGLLPHVKKLLKEQGKL